MSELKKTGLLAASITLLLSSSALADTIVLRGARVLTMDEGKPEASAIAIVDGKIAAVGADADVEKYLTSATVYDLPKDALVLPGFQDGHNHLIWSATEAKDVSFWDVTDEEGVATAINDADLESLPDGAWIRGSGWDIAAFPNASAEMLDKLTGDRPIYISSTDGHSAWVNTAALKAAGIADDTKDPDGGRIERDGARANGRLRESAMDLVKKFLPEYPEDQVDTGFDEAQAEAISYGVTALIDPSIEEWMLKGYRRADAAGKMKLRVKGAVKIEAKEGAAGVMRALEWAGEYGTPHFQVNAVKFFIDGVIETGTAALLEAYVGSNSSGDLLFTPEQLAEIATAADKAGLQLHSHAIGDRAVRATLDAYEAAQKTNGTRDSRHQITHLELINETDLPRFKSLGVLANIQALWAYPDSYIVDLTEPKLGPQRSEWLYPFGALKSAGATLVGASDWSVSSMNPLEAIQTGVTRQEIGNTEGRVLTPQHKLDVMDMLKAYTVNGAYAAFDEENSGTLTVGKRADIVVLDKDITRVVPTDIATGKVLITLISGQSAYEGEGMVKPTAQ
ncbi:MAG TPA: amidohydrolase [Rhizobiaceae bacterium]|nr:amidohydrolase [Rhizobiaceae bacterium]